MESLSNFNVKTLEIGGLGAALQALRLPFSKECRSNVDFKLITENEIDLIQYRTAITLQPKDLELMQILLKRGDEHAKVLRGIIVWCEINAPLCWWNEATTYKIGADCLASTSTMHTIGFGGISIRDFDVDPRLYEILDPEKKAKVINPLYFDPISNPRKVIKNYFGRDYEIWEDGKIFSLPYTKVDNMPDGSTRTRSFPKTELKLGNTKNSQGYYQVHLGGRQGCSMVLHRIFADAFCEHPEGCDVVNHKDGNKGNCSPSNLEWTTSSENNKHAFATGLHVNSLHTRYLNFKSNLKYSLDDIQNWMELKTSGKTYDEISTITGANSTYIAAIINGSYPNIDSLKLFHCAKLYEDLINEINDLSAQYKESGDFSYVVKIKELLPSSFIQKRVLMFNYQTLRRIYKQRKDHRLPHWHKFCDWIKTLPYSKELITNGLD